jgi:hypothetical protein
MPKEELGPSLSQNCNLLISPHCVSDTKAQKAQWYSEHYLAVKVKVNRVWLHNLLIGAVHKVVIHTDEKMYHIPIGRGTTT